jgi:hypothetical protein
MLSSYYGCYRSPAELARTPGLFDAMGRILWTKLNQVFAGRLTFDWRAYGRDDRRITASINGTPKTACVIQVNHQRHWVVGVGVNAPKDYWIADPIDGKRKILRNAYPDITGSAHFHGA